MPRGLSIRLPRVILQSEKEAPNDVTNIIISAYLSQKHPNLNKYVHVLDKHTLPFINNDL